MKAHTCTRTTNYYTLCCSTFKPLF